jgi:TM2 domain-containing membrane protein YozV
MHHARRQVHSLEPIRLEQDLGALMLARALRKSVGAAYTLWLTIGLVGGHRFYLGRPGTGVLQGMLLPAAIGGWVTGFGPFACAGLAAWWLVDAAFLPGWVAAHNEATAAARRSREAARGERRL